MKPTSKALSLFLLWLSPVAVDPYDLKIPSCFPSINIDRYLAAIFQMETTNFSMPLFTYSSFFCRKSSSPFSDSRIEGLWWGRGSYHHVSSLEHHQCMSCCSPCLEFWEARSKLGTPQRMSDLQQGINM